MTDCLSQALTGQVPTYGLGTLNLPADVIGSLETEEDLLRALGQEEEVEQVVADKEEVVVQRVRRASSVEQPAKSQGNIVKGLSTQGLEVEYDEIIEDGEYDDDQITLCFDCGKQAENPGDRLCIFCKNSENIQLERLGVKRKQTEQAEGMLAKSARRYAPTLVGDNVRVYLADVDKGRCEFPNVLAVVVSTSEGMFKLATKDGYLNSHYARNQFETLPTKHLLLSDVNTGETRALRTAANAQSTGGGQGFTRCGCNKACQTNACKCIKTKLMCNSRCHGRNSNPKCLNHD